MSRDPRVVAPQISRAAAEWFVLMREPRVAEADRDAFAAWLQASPVHVRTYLDMARLWGDAAGIDPAVSAVADGESASNVMPMRNAAPRQTNAKAAAGPGASGRGRAAGRGFRAIAASFVLMAGLGAAAVWWQLHTPPAYVAEVGEQRVITLEDGSIIWLNSRSEARVRMLQDQRLLELVEGQAMFDVASDPRRPFVVRSGNVAARVLGTRFEVYRKPSGTVVTVVEGQVEVLAGPTPWKGQVEAGQATIRPIWWKASGPRPSTVH